MKKRKINWMLYCIAGFIALAILGIFLRQSTKNYNTGKLYMITVFDGTIQKDYSGDSVISQTERCIEFIDIMGFEKKVCGTNITVTKIKTR